MTNFNYDTNGVPVLSGENIDRIADTVREWVGHQVDSQAGQTDVLGIYTKLKEMGQLVFKYEMLNGPSIDSKVLGKFCYGKPPTIVLDAEHENSSSHVRTRFTLAHELGHYALHRHRVIRKQEELIDTDDDLPRNLWSETEAPDWAEWQANYFAGALLLPKNATQQSLAKFQQESGIKRNFGYIYLHDSSGSKSAFLQALAHLASLFSVSKTAVEVRLHQIDMIKDHRVDSSSSITRLGNLLT